MAGPFSAATVVYLSLFLPSLPPLASGPCDLWFIERAKISRASNDLSRFFIKLHNCDNKPAHSDLFLFLRAEHVIIIEIF